MSGTFHINMTIVQLMTQLNKKFLHGIYLGLRELKNQHRGAGFLSLSALAKIKLRYQSAQLQKSVFRMGQWRHQHPERRTPGFAVHTNAT